MVKSSASSAAGKVTKPHKDFPLFPHASGRWAKKVRGQFAYFGSTADDPSGQIALALWLDQKDELLAGRKPRNKDSGLRLADLCNQFLTHKQSLVASGELAQRTFDRYYATAAMLVDKLGKNRIVEDLRPDDFQTLRASMAKRWGAVALGNEIQIVRSVFRFGSESGLFPAMRFGPAFKKPSAKTLRQTRAANGPRMFEAADIRKAIKKAWPNLRAMILLGVNGAMGNTDLALLPLSAIDLKGGWLDYPRAKTAIPRRIPLWPETVSAIKAVIAQRPEPKDPADAGLLFIAPRGKSFVGNHRGFRVHQDAARLFKSAGIADRTFYDLRRTFQTVAEGSRDLVAVQSIMGHAPASGDMSAIYRQRVDDARLCAVADHVHGWLFPTKKPGN